MSEPAPAGVADARLASGFSALDAAAAAGSAPDPRAAMTLAALQLWSGDPEGYAATRERLLRWAAGSTNVTALEWVAKLASLDAASPPPERAAALALARRAAGSKADPEHRPWHLLALGLAEFRHGNHAAAEAALAEAARPPAGPVPWDQALLESTAGFYRAMNLVALGQDEEARRLFNAAAGQLKPPNADDLIAWLALREARARLAGAAAPP